LTARGGRALAQVYAHSDTGCRAGWLSAGIGRAGCAAAAARGPGRQRVLRAAGVARDAADAALRRHRYGDEGANPLPCWSGWRPAADQWLSPKARWAPTHAPTHRDARTPPPSSDWRRHAPLQVLGSTAGLARLPPQQRHILGHSGCGNCWAAGHHAARAGDPPALRTVLAAARRQAERCDGLPDFLMLHSLGGGTGSGLGSAVLEGLRDEYPAAVLATVSVAPSLSGG